MGFRIKVIEVAHRSIGIDTIEDFEAVRRSQFAARNLLAN
jgi:CMP-2-keto-3-deoxyoctulosonic acid synthetase